MECLVILILIRLNQIGSVQTLISLIHVQQRFLCRTYLREAAEVLQLLPNRKATVVETATNNSYRALHVSPVSSVPP